MKQYNNELIYHVYGFISRKKYMAYLSTDESDKNCVKYNYNYNIIYTFCYVYSLYFCLSWHCHNIWDSYCFKVLT